MNHLDDDIKATESNEPKESMECNVCRHEHKCFTQDKFGQKQEVCPDCFFIEDRDY